MSSGVDDVDENTTSRLHKYHHADASAYVGASASISAGLSIIGTNNSELRYGSNSSDGINAKGGNDTIYANGGDDTVEGGNGSDLVYLGDGNDAIDGGADADTINGDDGDVLASDWQAVDFIL